MNRFMKWAQAMNKKKKMLIAITIVSGITISGIAPASNGWLEARARAAVTADHTIIAYFGLAGTYSESNTTIDLSSGNLNGWTGTIETCTFNGETDLSIVEGQIVELIVTVADDGTYAGYTWSYHFEAKRPDGTLQITLGSVFGEILGDSPQQATVWSGSQAGIWHVIFIVDSVEMAP